MMRIARPPAREDGIPIHGSASDGQSPGRRGSLLQKFLVATLAVMALALPASARADGQFARMFPTLAPLNGPTDQQLADLVQRQLDPNADWVTAPASRPSSPTSGSSSTTTSRSTFRRSRHRTSIRRRSRTAARRGSTSTASMAVVPASARSSTRGRWGASAPGPTAEPQRCPRPAAQSRRLGDPEPRNDENQVIAQMHLAFLELHNHFIDLGQTFAEARRNVLDRYRRVSPTTRRCGRLRPLSHDSRPAGAEPRGQQPDLAAGLAASRGRRVRSGRRRGRRSSSRSPRSGMATLRCGGPTGSSRARPTRRCSRIPSPTCAAA